MQCTFEDGPEHLLVIVEGEWVLSSVLKMLDEVARACRTRGYNRVLADCRAVHGLVTEGDRFVAGTRVAERLGKTRAAFVFSTAQRVTKFGEKVAIKRGASLLVTTDMDEALRYLKLS